MTMWADISVTLGQFTGWDMNVSIAYELWWLQVADAPQMWNICLLSYGLNLSDRLLNLGGFIC